MKHYTASTYIFKDEKVLLIFHRKLKKWMGAGGHVDEGELPHEAALRETKEETGLDVALLHDEKVWITPKFNGKSIPRPTFMLLENIPAYKEVPEHQHIDCIYLATPIGGELMENPRETEGIGWFALEELSSLEMFEETREVVVQLFPLHQGCAQTRKCSAQDDVLPLPLSDAESHLEPALK